MLDSGRGRVLAVLVLLGALFGLTVWYGTLQPAPEDWALPDQGDLASDYDAYVGERVQVGGDIVSVDPLAIEAEHGVSGHLRLRVTDLDPSISLREGRRLVVYGVAEEGLRVRSLNAYAVPERGIRYTYSISFLAGLWVLVRIVRDWRFDRGSWLVRREGPLWGDRGA